MFKFSLSKPALICLIALNLIITVYLLLPVPSIPDLPNSLKSTEPGDTVQLDRVKAFYTNQYRQEIINFYKNNYHHPLLIIINHPPEKAKQIFKDTIQSYYLEEFIIPFKQSLFINGYEWENDVFTKPEKRVANQLLIDGQVYKSKVTLRYFPTSLLISFLDVFLIEATIIAAISIYRKIFFHHA